MLPLLLIIPALLAAGAVFKLISGIIGKIRITVDVVMMGAAGSGKTTVLLAMQEQFKHVSNFKELSFGFDSVTRHQVDRERHDISVVEALVLADKYPPYGIVIPLKPSGNHNEYKAFLASGGNKNAEADPNITLRFHDFPGGWIVGDRSTEENRSRRKQVNACVATSQVLIITVDAPYLMEEYGGASFQDARNLPSEIATILKESSPFSSSKRCLVLLVPVRCEKYIKSDEGRAALSARIKESYWELLAICRDKRWVNTVKVAVCSVQTVGFLEFAGFTDRGLSQSFPDPIFLPGDGWPKAMLKLTPRFTEQVLYHVLLHAFAEYLGGTKDANAAKAAEKIRGELKTGAGFEVLQKGYDS